MAGKLIVLENGAYFDFSKALLNIEEIDEYEELFDKALRNLADLEAGEIANIDEERMVGHYWLRDSDIAPSGEIEENIKTEIKKVKVFSENIKETFKGMIYIGIGGSALGPQLISSVFKDGNSKDFRVIDNTDPETFYDLTKELGDELREYLIVTVSKSGNTQETNNILNEFKFYFLKQGWDFTANAICITSPGSKLEEKAISERWLEIFYIWDWVGGRMSISSVVGLLPLAFLGKNIDKFLEGLRSADKAGRRRSHHNPTLFMALDLYLSRLNFEKRQLIVLPYKDKLEVFPKYLQQLIMESIGKSGDGIAVYGNKGSSDQHSYIQQLFDGPDNFSVNFITVNNYKKYNSPLPNENFTSDYLFAFQLGTAKALFEEGRKSITLSIPELNEYYLGFLIGIYERITGFYAAFAEINAYNQPAVEKGKKAAGQIVTYKNEILKFLKDEPEKAFFPEKVAKILECTSEEIFSIMEYMYLSGLYPIEKIDDKEECNYLDYSYKYKQ